MDNAKVYHECCDEAYNILFLSAGDYFKNPGFYLEIPHIFGGSTAYKIKYCPWCGGNLDKIFSRSAVKD